MMSDSVRVWVLLGWLLVVGFAAVLQLKRGFRVATAEKRRRLSVESGRTARLEVDAGSVINRFWRSDPAFGRLSLYDDILVLVTPEREVVIPISDILEVQRDENWLGKNYLRVHHTNSSIRSPLVLFGVPVDEIISVLHDGRPTEVGGEGRST
jgi:hypothetical protein